LFEKQDRLSLRALNLFPASFPASFCPWVSRQMVMLDQDFQKKNYDFKFVRQEFLGEVRCLVLDVQPKGNAGGRFFWDESGWRIAEYNIVRFNVPTLRIRAIATICISTAGA